MSFTWRQVWSPEHSQASNSFFFMQCHDSGVGPSSCELGSQGCVNSLDQIE